MGRIEEITEATGLTGPELRNLLKNLIHESEAAKKHSRAQLERRIKEKNGYDPQKRREPSYGSRTVHKGDFNHPEFPHGTHKAYANYKCRCPLCVSAYSDYMKDFRARKKLSSGN